MQGEFEEGDLAEGGPGGAVSNSLDSSAGLEAAKSWGSDWGGSLSIERTPELSLRLAAKTEETDLDDGNWWLPEEWPLSDVTSS